MLLATVAPSGGDYTTLAAAEAGEQTDLDALGSPGEIECESMVDTASVTVDGWTTSATNPLTIRAAAGHEPNLALTSGYRLQGANSFITIAEEYVRWDAIGHLSTINSGTTRTFYTFSPSSANVADFRLTNCVFKGSGMGGNGSHQCVLLGNNNSGSLIEVRGNVFYDWVTGGSGTPTVLSAGSGSYNTPVYVHNNTFVNCVAAVACPSATTTFRLTNNLFSGCTTDVVNSGQAHGDSDYNATDAASGLPGANSRHSQTFTFVDEGADDFHLASGDAGAKGHGADLSAHAVYPFSTDIDGDTITGAWSIGADWITAGSGPSATAAGTSAASAAPTLLAAGTAGGTSSAGAIARVLGACLAAGVSAATAAAVLLSGAIATGTSTATAAPRAHGAAQAVGTSRATASPQLLGAATAAGTSSASASAGEATLGGTATGSSSASAAAQLLGVAAASGQGDATAAATLRGAGSAQGLGAATAAARLLSASVATGAASASAAGQYLGGGTAAGSSTASAGTAIAAVPGPLPARASLVVTPALASFIAAPIARASFTD